MTVSKKIYSIRINLTTNAKDLAEKKREKFSLSKDESLQFVMGDGHGHFFKLFENIMTHTDLITFKNPKIHQKINTVCARVYAANGKILEKDLDRLETIITKEMIIHPEKVGSLTFIGDVLADRGPHDLLTLLLIDKLYKEKVHLINTLSNHDLEFILSYEQILADIKKHGGLENFQKYKAQYNKDIQALQKKIDYLRSETLISPDVIKAQDKLSVYEEQHPAPAAFTSSLGENQSHSLFALKQSIDSNPKKALPLMQKVLRLMDSYKATSRLFHYSIAKNDQGQSTGLSLHVHGVCGLRTVFATARKLGVIPPYTLLKDVDSWAQNPFFPDTLQPEGLEAVRQRIQHLEQDIALLGDENANFQEIRKKYFPNYFNSHLAVMKACQKELEYMRDLHDHGLHTILSTYDTPEKLAKLIDQINDKWHDHLQNNTASSLFNRQYFDMDNPRSRNGYCKKEEYPLECATWLRDAESPYCFRPAKLNGFDMSYIHGHDATTPSNGHCFNLDYRPMKSEESYMGKPNLEAEPSNWLGYPSNWLEYQDTASGPSSVLVSTECPAPKMHYVPKQIITPAIEQVEEKLLPSVQQNEASRAPSPNKMNDSDTVAVSELSVSSNSNKTWLGTLFSCARAPTKESQESSKSCCYPGLKR